MKNEFLITEKFEISGRGAVVVIEEVTERISGKPYKVEVRSPGGKSIAAEAYKELVLKRLPTPVEKEAYMLKGLHKDDVPENSRLVFL